MVRSVLTLFALVIVSTFAAASPAVSVTRERVVGDVYHYEFVVKVGTTANAQLHIHRVVRERAPYLPRPSSSAIMMMHGDFASFPTNFVPSVGTPASTTTGMGTWLAQRGIDVWGLDRRWTQPPREDGDTSDFGDMGVVQELADIRTALGFARGIRLVTDASVAKMTLVGFSRGGQLSYIYASDEAKRPLIHQHLKGLVPLDVYAKTAPADDDLRQFFCSLAGDEAAALADGFTDSPNDFQIDTGEGDLNAPDEQTPYQGFLPGFTNHEAFLLFAGQSYVFFPASPVYHLAAAQIVDGNAVAVTQSPESVLATWFAGAPDHQSMREAAETDQLICNEAPLAIDFSLARIRIPLFLIGAAGGYGDHAVYTTTQVSSTDVSTLVIRRLPVAEEEQDFGHGDLLYARDAATLAWQPLLSWLHGHE